MARKRSIAPLPLSLFAVLASCELSLEGAPCPCASGQECCNGHCVPSGSDCPTAHDAGAGGSDPRVPSPRGGTGGAPAGDAGRDGHGGALPGRGGAEDGGTDAGADGTRAGRAGGGSTAPPGGGEGGVTAEPGGPTAGASGAGAQPVSPIAPIPPEYCTKDRWCGGALDLVAIWGSAPDELWVIGHDGSGETVLLHRSGERWSSHPMSDVVENWDERFVAVRAVWGSASDDVWFAGDTFLHFGSDGFKEFPLLDEGGGVTSELISVQGLWGSGPNDVWAVDDGWIMRWDGTKWTLRSERAAGALRAIGGSSANDVWAVGVAGCAMHWNGSAWSNCRERAAGIPTSLELSAVWSRGENDTFAVGGSFLMRQAGATWTARDLSTTAPDFEGTAVSSSDGVAWIGSYGLIARADEDGGVSFLRTQLDPVKAFFRLPGGEIWAVGSASATAYFDGARWSELAPATTATFSAIWAVSETCVWAAADNGAIFRFDGNAWTQITRFAGAVNAIWAASEDDLWIVGSSFWHWDGADWRELPIADDGESEIERVWGASSDEVWAIGERGSLFRLDGNNFARVESPAEAELESIWGSGPNDVWLTAADDGPWHWDGSSWTLASIVIDGEVRHPTLVTGSSASDVWFLGSTNDEQLEVTHWTGSAWVTHDTPALARAAADPVAWVGQNCELWVLGDSFSPTIAVGHLAGAEWQFEDSGATGWLQAMTGTAGELWAAGGYGALVRKRVNTLSAGSSCGTGTQDPLACEPGVQQALTEPCGACDAGTRRRSRTCTEQRRWGAWTIGACENVQIECSPGSIRCCQDGSLTGTETCSSSCVWSGCVPCSFQCAC